MLKRVVIGIVLFSMMLHCAGRLGILSYAYEQRFQIAFTLGLIDEMPMTMCSHEYYADGGLDLQYNNHESPNSIPSATFTSQEINLFFSTVPAPTTMLSGLTAAHHTGIVQGKYLPPALSIFHPPC